MRRSLAVLLVLIVVLAGCSTSYAENPVWMGDEDNHWREETLTVAVEMPANSSRDYRPLVREALDYWAANSKQYAGFPIQYELERNATDPDLVVDFVPTIENCGRENHTAGCAPVLTAPTQVDRPVRVRVMTTFSDESTVQVLKHELGHTLGLTHDDPPESVMAAKSTLTTPPQPDATERALSWDAPELSVYVDDTNVSAADRDEARRQVREALDYYARGAGGTVPENVTFVRTDDRSAADVVIRFRDSAPCSSGSGSCGAVSGRDPDGDGALEYYTRLEITLVDIDPPATGWHVGRWLGYGFGHREKAEFPPPLRQDASAEERRSEWWTSGASSVETRAFSSSRIPPSPTASGIGWSEETCSVGRKAPSRATSSRVRRTKRAFSARSVSLYSTR
jgi:hypothetical protein